jgi:hypothetical protein
LERIHTSVFGAHSLDVYTSPKHPNPVLFSGIDHKYHDLYLYSATVMGVLALLRNRQKVAGLAWQAMALRGLQSTSALLEPAPKPVPLSKLKDSFLDGTSSTYLEELEERYRANPASVDKTWASFFNSMGK